MKEYISLNGLGQISLFHIHQPAGYIAHLPHGTSAETMIIILSGCVRCQIPGQDDRMLTPDEITLFSKDQERTSCYLTDTHLLSVHLHLPGNTIAESAVQVKTAAMNEHSAACLSTLAQVYTANRPLSEIAAASCLYGLLDACIKHAEPELPRKFRTISAVKQAIDNDFISERPITEYAKDAAMSVSAFRRLFSEYTGKTPVRYRLEKRLEYACLLVSSGECNISEAAARAGFNSLPYFSRLFRKTYDCSLSEYLHRNTNKTAGERRIREDSVPAAYLKPWQGGPVPRD